MAIVSPSYLRAQNLLFGDIDMSSLGGYQSEYDMQDPSSYHAPFDQYDQSLQAQPHAGPSHTVYRFPPARYDEDYASTSALYAQSGPSALPLFQPHAVRPIQPLPARYTPPRPLDDFNAPYGSLHQHAHSWPQASFPELFPGSFSFPPPEPAPLPPYQPAMGVRPVATAPGLMAFDAGIDGLGALAGSLDLSTGTFYNTQEHPRMRTAQACDACRTRKAKVRSVSLLREWAC